MRAQHYKPPDEGPSEYQTIPLSKIEDFGVHCKSYYPLDIAYFKSSLDAGLLDLLWAKYWVGACCCEEPCMCERCCGQSTGRAPAATSHACMSAGAGDGSRWGRQVGVLRNKRWVAVSVLLFICVYRWQRLPAPRSCRRATSLLGRSATLVRP